MRAMENRIKKLEGAITGKARWAVFAVSSYADEHVQEAAYEHIVNDHVAQGNLRPTHRIFLRNVGGSCMPGEEKFVCAF